MARKGGAETAPLSNSRGIDRVQPGTQLTAEQLKGLRDKVVVRGGKDVKVDSLPEAVQLAAFAAAAALETKFPKQEGTVIVQGDIHGDRVVPQVVMVAGAKVDRETGALSLIETPETTKGRGLWKKTIPASIEEVRIGAVTL